MAAHRSSGPLKNQRPIDLKDPLIGQTVFNKHNDAEKYRIEAMLGAGGNAKIYKATDLANNRIVSLKFAPTLEDIMRSEGSKTKANERKDQIYARFIREAETLAKLSRPDYRHPHVILVYGGGGVEIQGATGVLPYMAMEYIDGLSLAQLLEQGPILWPVAQDILLQVCDALSYVHGEGILHRDIKPDNIMLTLKEDKRYQAKLIDFGSVRLSDVATITMDTTVGTMRYISPEQLNRSQEVTAQSDVYSLGCTMYEMVTGSVPFTHPDLYQLTAAIIKESPDSPRKRVPDRGIPRKLCPIILRALEKKPEKRYHDVRGFAAAISSVKWNDKGSHKRPHPILWLEKHPRTFALAIGATALMATGTGFYLYNHFFRMPNAVAQSISIQVVPPIKAKNPLLDSQPVVPSESTHVAPPEVPKPESTAVVPEQQKKPTLKSYHKRSHMPAVQSKPKDTAKPKSGFLTPSPRYR